MILTDMISQKVIGKFHEDRTKIVHIDSVLPYNENCLDPGGHAFNGTETKTAPTPGGHLHDDWAKNVTSRETNVLTKFHENWAKNVTSRVEKCTAHWRPCFSPIWTIFEIVRDINKTNVLSNFHDNWAKIVTSTKTALPTGGHVFQGTRTTFHLNQHII
ncbi:hypothetical protein DPMN_032308 [Dreissena polymorpha]|uniref:Uncharacterized protein n=1 Tax=Dreissena polymorpha TaxID=45954 RepID=A0A9D4M3Z3_DREPO|nr:hypothetical protein DPMN_032308 [Dreissena polymorpha]